MYSFLVSRLDKCRDTGTSSQNNWLAQDMKRCSLAAAKVAEAAVLDMSNRRVAVESIEDMCKSLVDRRSKAAGYSNRAELGQLSPKDSSDKAVLAG